MKTNIEFASGQFPAEPGEEQQVNPERYGKRLADFLAKGIAQNGFKVQRIVPQDWGWKIEIENTDFPLWIGCGNYPEFENGFLCFIEPSKPFLRKWLKKIETKSTVEKLGAAIESALMKPAAAASRIRWWEANER